MRTQRPLLPVALAVGTSLLATGFRPLHPRGADRAADDPASNCGMDLELIPDFALTDVNPASATYGQTITRDSLLGQPMVMYWAQPS